jgi:hypothetical protein
MTASPATTTKPTTASVSIAAWTLTQTHIATENIPMNKPYFVMVHNQRGTAVLPMVEESGEVSMFASVTEAVDAANENDMAIAFGYDVFMAGAGIDGGDGISR